MKLRRTLLGIVLAFSTAGIIATNTDAEAYQELYEQQDQQEIHIKEVLASEFISEEDQDLLNQGLDRIEEAEQTETRRSLRLLMEEEKKQLSQVQQRVVSKEAEVAKSELTQLIEKFETLEKKSQEPYIVAEDSLQIESLKSELKSLTSVQKVLPIRTLSGELSTLSTQMSENQSLLVDSINELKELNKESAQLFNKEYLLASDKEALKNAEEENAQYFEDADDFELVKSRKSDSQQLIRQLKTKQEKTEKDFQENKSQTNELVKTTNSLISEGDLTSEEKDKLSEVIQTLSNALEMTDYEPGDLAKNYTILQTNYNEFMSNSNQRIAAAKEKAEAEAKEKAEREKEEAAAQQAAQKSSNSSSSSSSTSSNTSSSTSTPSPSLSGEWYQAPSGYKFLKVESGKTYGQVKNKNNFKLITEAEASNYTPGHGNGYAKQ
ncbi:hypothetical protein JTF06_12730 [Desemzia sp. RIT804]|uniref:hypothetical protein n=1 Tax=Desemzia sp. RIT 804 TaxID=2810209 RepID=UPI00194EF676|nr:hypothetical protein [Desemzia sp. RIT 804]MBM6615750.1 hypothetical protein [Desemzia sp. RIT 804]